MSNPQPQKNFFRRYPLALGCAALASLLLAAYLVRQGTLSESREGLAQLETEGRTIERNVRNAVGIEEHADALKQGVARLESMLTRVGDISGNQDYFYRLESISGVRISVLTPLGAPKTVDLSAAYQPAGFRVVVEGTYAQLCGFLRALECGQRLYRLNDFSLQRATSDMSAGSVAQREVLTINLQLLASK